MKKLYPLFLSLLLPFLPYAQTVNDLVVKGLVTVQPEGLLYVQGDVDIQSPSGTLDIQSSGSLHGQVKVDNPRSVGIWKCSGTTSGGGDVTFLSTGVIPVDDYQVSGSNVSFPNLILNFGDPSLHGGVQFGVMTLSNNITVGSALTLTKGRIITGSNEVYIADSSANAISGSFGLNGSRYIQGTLRREIRAGRYYRFPVGGAPGTGKKGYNPAAVDLRTVTHVDAVIPSGVTSIRGKFVEQTKIGTISRQYTTSGDCYFTTAQQYLEFYWMVQKYGYWNFKPNDTTKSSNWHYDFYVFPDRSYINDSNPGLTHLKIFKAPSTAGNPSANFDWNPYFFQSGNPCNGVNFNGGSYLWHPTAPGTLSTTDSIAAWDLTSFSNFGLGGGTGAGLPIELLELKAIPVNNSYISVEWATSTETNNKGFEVLRSTDGVNFTKIGWRDGAINSTTIQYYDFPDHEVIPNQLYYYRLNQIDFGGASDSTYVVTAMITAANTFTISEFIPNPSANNSNTHIKVVSSNERDLNVTVYNTLAQVIMKTDYHVVSGENSIDFNFDLLADGTYYAIIRADNEYFNRKLILTK